MDELQSYDISMKANEWKLFSLAVKVGKTLGHYGSGNIYRTKYDTMLIYRYMGGAGMIVFETTIGLEDFIKNNVLKG